MQKLNDRAKEENQRQEAKIVLYSFSHKRLGCVELWNSPFHHTKSNRVLINISYPEMSYFKARKHLMRTVLMKVEKRVCKLTRKNIINMLKLTRVVLDCPISGAKAAHDYSTCHSIHILFAEQKLEY